MITNFNKNVNESLGISLALPANGLGGSRATSLLVAHFALQNTASNFAEKKNRPREGVAGFLIGGFAQKKFEHQSKNTAGDWV